MKNMKKLLRKAMVFTLTAAMLVGTPLTASAAGLVDLYQSEDALANTDSDQKTGTGTGTGTGSKGLDELPADLLGIYLDNTELEVEHPNTGSLVATLDWSSGKPADQKKLLENVEWESSNSEVIAVGKTSIDEGSGTSTVVLEPKLPGTATVTATLSSKDGNSFSAEATVTVIRYADDLKFRKEIEEEAYTGNTIDLDYFVDRYIDGKIVDYTSDTLTFSYKLDESNANKNCATLKNGVLTLKKTGNVKVLAVGQKKITTKEGRVGTEWYSLEIKEGNNAKKIEFSVGNDSTKVKKTTLKVNNGKELSVTAEVTDRVDNSKDCNNRISWSSKKPEIVAIKTAPAENLKLNANKSTVILEAKAVGKAQIIAKTSNGKSATLTVTVSADLTKIEIANAPKTAYSGQTVDLYDAAVQSFGKNPGDAGNEDFGYDAGLKWSFDATGKDLKDMKSAASINAKGVLTVKPDLTKAKVKTVKVTAKSAKKVNGEYVVAKAAVNIDLKQVNITSIKVVRGTELASAALNSAETKVIAKKGNDTIDAGKNIVYTYTLDVKGKVEEDNGTMRDLKPEEAGAYVGWTASGNGKIVKASKDEENNGVITPIKKGSATITINAATQKKNGKYIAIKTTLKDKVNAPSKTLTLSVKNKGITAKSAAQKITIKPILEKGTTTKNNDKDIIWTATLKKNDGTSSSLTATKGKVSLPKNGYEAGNEVVVNARVINGPSTTITLPVVKSGKVKFDNSKPKLEMSAADESKSEFNTTVNVTVGGDKPGVGVVSPVTYTVNKPGIVRIKDLGEGQLQINAVTNGTVKITATTLDGKKATATVKVSKVTYNAAFWKQNQ